MENSISKITFSERETKYYTEEFEKLTSSQKKPLHERELMGAPAATFFKQLKINNEDLSSIWDLVSESKGFLRLPNFMAAMRLCSAKKQGKDICKENYEKEQSVLARKKKPKKTSDTSEMQDINLQNSEQPQPTEVITPESPIEVPEEVAHSAPVEPSKPKMPSIAKVYSSPLSQIEEESSPRVWDFVVSVESPTLVASGWFGSSSYYLYTIVTRNRGKIYTVKRRFRDLDWLHTQILKKYKGYNIPPLPEKKLLCNTDEKFIEERRADMQKYLNLLASHSEISSSPFLKLFLQCPNDKFETEKNKVEENSETPEFLGIEDTYDRLMASVQNKMQLVFNHKLVPFSSEISEIQEKITRLEAPTQAFCGAFVHSVSCQDETNFNFTKLSIPELEKFNRIIQSYSSELKKASVNKAVQEIKEQQLRLDGLKQAINSYKETLAECSCQEALISRKLAKHRSSCDEETAAKYLSEIQRTQTSIDKLHSDIETIKKNVQKENTTFESGRTQHFSETLKQMITSQNEFHANEALFWQKAFETMKTQYKII